MANEGGIEDERALIAALLHDTLEDTARTEQERVRGFGRVIADIVREVSNERALPKTERKYRQIEHASQLSRRARLVKLADKISNLRDVTNTSPADWSLEDRQAYFDWARDVVAGLWGTHPALERIFDEVYKARP